MSHFLSKVYIDMNCELSIIIIIGYLQNILQDQLENYFQDDVRERNKWTRNLLKTEMHEDHSSQPSLEVKSSFMEISCDRSMKYTWSKS